MRKIRPLLVICIALCGCIRGTPAPIASPDGTMTLRTHIEQGKKDRTGYLCVVIEIFDNNGHVLHTENTHASDRMRWDISWVSNNRIQLNSSDIGKYYWDRQADGTWNKEDPYAKGTTESKN